MNFNNNFGLAELIGLALLFIAILNYSTNKQTVQLLKRGVKNGI